MLASGAASFLQSRKMDEDFVTISLPNHTKHYPVAKPFLVMKNFEDKTVWKNSSCRTYHLGDNVLGLEWNTKMNSIGGEVLEGIQKSIALRRVRLTKDGDCERWTELQRRRQRWHDFHACDRTVIR